MPDTTFTPAEVEALRTAKNAVVRRLVATIDELAKMLEESRAATVEARRKVDTFQPNYKPWKAMRGEKLIAADVVSMSWSLRYNDWEAALDYAEKIANKIRDRGDTAVESGLAAEHSRSV